MNKHWPYLTNHWSALFGKVISAMALALIFLAGQTAHAQTTYAYRNDVFAYDTPSGAATSIVWHASGAAPGCTGFPNGDDDWADVAFPGGFTFTFGGVSYSSVRVYSNGILAFPTDISGYHTNYTSQALPITAASTHGVGGGCPNAVPKNLMVVYWLDIVAGTANSTTGASVQYELLGTAPNRRFVISWVNVKLYNTTTRYNFQVELLESAAGVNGNFKYQYTTGSSDGTGATVGVQLTTTDYTQYAYNQQFIDTTLGTTILWYPANQLIAKSAEYRFDESAWTGVAGEIKDTSGNSRNASRVGAAANVAFGTFPGGKLCRGGSFTNNTSNATIDAVATPIVPGNQGSIDFWFNSNVKWNAASSAAMLFDATTVANRPFFLMKSASGALTFVVSDSVGTTITATAPAQSYALNTWHHVGVAWNVRVGTNQTDLQIFLDGVLQNGGPTRGTTNGFLPALSTIYIGDNRTSGITPTGGTPNGANGSIDEVYVYDVEISTPQALADMNLTRATCTVLDHFHIKHDGTNSSCTAPGNITIEAHDSTHALFSLAGTSMNLSTSPAHGTWSNVAGGAINLLTAIGAGTGTATYTFAGETTVTFGLSNTLTEALNINVASGATTEHTGTASSCVASDYTNGSVTTCDDSRNFVCAVPFGFNCVESGANALNGHLYTKLAGTAFTFDVVALKDANSDGVADAVETTYASGADKSVTVELVDGSGTTLCASRTAISPAVSQTLVFTKVGQPTDLGRKSAAAMTVTKAYPDLRCRVTDANQVPNIVSCSTDDFSVRPTQFTITSSNAGNAGTSGSPAIKTEAAFSLTATAVAGYGGTPLINTALLIGSPTVGNLTGSFPTATAATGIATGATFTYSEVGTLGLNANAVYDSTFTSVDSSNDCTADFSNVSVSGKYGCSFGNAAVPLSSGFGRFIPDHFDTTVVLAAGVPMACPTGFTCPTLYNGSVYSSQPFNVSTAAKNLSGATTQNYSSSAGYSKAVTLSPFAGKGSPTAVAGTLSGNKIAASGFTLGVGTLPAFTYGFTASAPPNLPTDIYLRAVEDAGGDSVSSLRVTNPTTTSVEGGVKVLQGRFWIPNVYGSELLALPITTTVQYYNGTFWATSAMDSITSFNSNLTSVAGGNVVATVVSGLSGGVSVQSPGPAAVAAGQRTITLAAPGQGQSGNVNISLNAPIYLPSTIGRATFGIFRSPLIYRRENY